MNKKQIIALFVAFAFLSLLQVSTMPLRADQAPDQAGTTVSSPEQAPSFIEEEGYGSAPAKKSIMPVILIGLGVAVVAAVLVLVVFKTKYDIVGEWDYKWRDSGATTWTTQRLVFSGSKSSGSVTYFFSSGNVTGTYTVDAKKLAYSWMYTSGTKLTAIGEFQTKDNVTGTWSTQYGMTGDWELIRKVAAPTGFFPGATMGLDR